MTQFFATKYFLKASMFWNETFLAGIGNFGGHYFYESQIFD
jgi:hypothetical protein